MGYKREAAGLPEAGGTEQKFCPIRIGGVAAFTGDTLQERVLATYPRAATAVLLIDEK
ncbi:MAG: hypothetical protein ACLSHL_04770 [Alistipes communis]|jgi:hypothetical protein|nr:hypothetical protein A6CPBBH3_04600 [Alistipes communis]